MLSTKRYNFSSVISYLCKILDEGTCLSMRMISAQRIPFAIAERHQDKYVVDTLMSKLEESWFRDNGNRAGYDALSAAMLGLSQDPGDSGFLPLLLGEYGCANIIHENPRTPPTPRFALLILLATRSSPTALDCILKHGAALKMNPLQKMRAMQGAIGPTGAECLKVLLDHGFGKHLHEDQGLTPLHGAVMRGN
jgi:hypothetical protein